MLDPYKFEALFMLKRRKVLRLKEFDYSSPGAYFITICSYRNMLYFDNEKVRQVILRMWNEIPLHYKEINLDEFVIMPNHIHGILWIDDSSQCYTKHRSGLGRIVASFKASVTRELHAANMILGNVWQRNYYERVIRGDEELNSIRKYISENPIKWRLDKENPENVSSSGRACPTTTENISALFERNH